MKKRVLSILLTFAMLLTLTPMVLADNEVAVPYEVLPVSGITASYTANSHEAGAPADYLVDGNPETLLLLSGTGDNNECYAQLDLGAAKNLAQIDYQVGSTSDNNWRNFGIKFEVSNDVDFKENVRNVLTIAREGIIHTLIPNHIVINFDDSAIDEGIVVNSENCSSFISGDYLTVNVARKTLAAEEEAATEKPYQYIRVTGLQKTVYGDGNNYLGCREITVKEYVPLWPGVIETTSATFEEINLIRDEFGIRDGVSAVAVKGANTTQDATTLLDGVYEDESQTYLYGEKQISIHIIK